jgi:hypothetical protein
MYGRTEFLNIRLVMTAEQNVFTGYQSGHFTEYEKTVTHISND